MHAVLVSALALTAADRALFAPAPIPTAAYPSALAGPQAAYGAPMPSVAGPAYVQPLAVAAPARSQADQSFAVYAAAAGLCAAVASLSTVQRGRPSSAVAELDAESAASAAKIAMLFSSGKASKAKPGRKPAARKPAAKKAAAKAGAGSGSFGFFGGGASSKTKPTTRGRPAPKKAVKKVEKKELTPAGEVVVTLLSAPLRLTKAFFSTENWAYQAFNLVAGLPAANAKNKPKDNTQRGF